MINIFEEKGFKPGQKIKYDGFEMTVDSCWKTEETILGLKPKVPMLCCHFINSGGFHNIEFDENQLERIEIIE